MKLNCKPGDLAVIVKSDAGNEGKIVRCIRLEEGGFHLAPDGSKVFDIWEIDTPLKGWCDGMDNSVADRQLRPIRDQPGNEQFVTESRKSLPRSATAKGDTITERGELA